jgi:hypothetical protein
MRPHICAIAIAAASLAIIACDDASVPTEPSAFKNELDFAPLVLPRLTMSIAHARCSTVTPVATPVTLNVTASHFPVTLAEVRFQSLDPFRSTAPPIIFDTSALTRQFGSISVESFAVRQFPFTLPLGCLGGTLLRASVLTTDNGGVSRLQTMEMPVY